MQGNINEDGHGLPKTLFTDPTELKTAQCWKILVKAEDELRLIFWLHLVG